MNKCEWKDGLLTCCDLLHKDITRSFQSQNNWDKMVHRGYAARCPYCHTPLVKPEPEVTIKKSGGTWVARYDGVDWLYTSVPGKKEPNFKPNHPAHCFMWKPISGITITDEIAKLRPMVVTPILEKLVYISDNCITAVGDVYDASSVRLATVSDLP